MKVAVIPARGGSKRIPMKNIKVFHGKPIIAWSIEAALESGCFDKVIVSTDDERIAQCAREHGAETPFVRPPELSDDFVGTAEVIRHSINWLESQGSIVSHVCCIYATAPFTSSVDLRDGFKLLEENDVDFVLPVAKSPFPIQRALRIGGDGLLKMMEPDMYNVRSQDLEPSYHDAGQFYWATRDAWMTEAIPYMLQVFPMVIPRYRVQDIDDLEDWEAAELMFKVIRGE